MTWPNYSPACRKAVNDLLKRGGSLSAYRANPNFPSWTGPLKGSYAYRLEREVEKQFKVKHAVAVNSGTAALHCALDALDLKPGDEVITSPFSFSATVAAIIMAGGTPVFADVEGKYGYYDYTISDRTVKPVMTKRTKAILPVHLFGRMANMKDLLAFGVPVIEDACQAVGAKWFMGRDQDYSGTMGLAGAYSMNGTKNAPAGELGVMVTNSDKVAERARLLMNHSENFKSDRIGFNYRPNELTACVGYHGVLNVKERNNKRYDLAYKVWMGTPSYAGFQLPVHRREEHAYYVFPVNFCYGMEKYKPNFVKRMRRMGIPVSEGYIQPPLHRYRAFKKYQRTPLPNVEEYSSRTLCILSTLTPDRPLSYASHVADCMRKALE